MKVELQGLVRGAPNEYVADCLPEVEVPAVSINEAAAKLGAALTRLVADGGPKPAPAVPIIDGASILDVERKLPHDKYGLAVGHAKITATLTTSDGFVTLTGEGPALDRALTNACSDRRTVSLVVDGTKRSKKLDHSGCQRELQRVKEARNTDLRKERDRLKEALEQVTTERGRRLPPEAMTALQATADARAREIWKLEAEKAELQDRYGAERDRVLKLESEAESARSKIATLEERTPQDHREDLRAHEEGARKQAARIKVLEAEVELLGKKWEADRVRPGTVRAALDLEREAHAQTMRLLDGERTNSAAKIKALEADKVEMREALRFAQGGYEERKATANRLAVESENVRRQLRALLPRDNAAAYGLELTETVDAVVAHAAKIGVERDHYHNQAVGFGEDLAKTRTELETLKAGIEALIARAT
jgi:chromosome segregation ATPase